MVPEVREICAQVVLSLRAAKSIIIWNKILKNGNTIIELTNQLGSNSAWTTPSFRGQGRIDWSPLCSTAEKSEGNAKWKLRLGKGTIPIKGSPQTYCHTVVPAGTSSVAKIPFPYFPVSLTLQMRPRNEIILSVVTSALIGMPNMSITTKNWRNWTVICHSATEPGCRKDSVEAKIVCRGLRLHTSVRAFFRNQAESGPRQGVQFLKTSLSPISQTRSIVFLFHNESLYLWPLRENVDLWCTCEMRGLSDCFLPVLMTGSWDRKVRKRCVCSWRCPQRWNSVGISRDG